MSRQCMSHFNEDSVLLFGYHRKLKTMKKKYFVLHKETTYNEARIEYYDNEKKFKSGLAPKRVINIKNCFNINRRLYTKHDYVIVLSSKEGGFGIVLDSEEDMNTWLKNLLMLQKAIEITFDFPNFDYVWQVIIQKKGIAEQQGIFGSYHICLTNKSVTFIKIGQEKNAVADKRNCKIEVLLTTIRRCGDSQCFFYMEIGRQSTLGPGELWMETEDSLTAQNMHRMILSKMTSLNEALADPMRKRSSSATEASNPLYDRKSVHIIDKANNYLQAAQNFSRERCDSLPSRNRTSSECSTNSIRIPASMSIHRVLNVQGSNSSPIAYSASEESVSVDDSEESMGVLPYLLSTRTSEGVIPEECIDESLSLDTTQISIKHNDAGYISSKTLFPIRKGLGDQISSRQIFDDNKSNESHDFIVDVDGHFQRPVRAYSVGNRTEHNQIQISKDKSGECIGNRVRAFSVGSRLKNTRTCIKTSPKYFNSNNIEINSTACESRKSVSVPMLINKNYKSVEQMSDLMEIDFSKSLNKTTSIINQHPSQNDCQNSSNTQRHLDVSNSSESLSYKCFNHTDNGYLEMKPISVDSPNMLICNINDDTSKSKIRLLDATDNICQQYSIICTKSNSGMDELMTTTNLKDSAHPHFDKKHECLTDNECNTADKNMKCNLNVNQPSSDNVLNPGALHCLLNNCNIKNKETVSLNRELYYASLDLPLSSNDFKTRSSFKESLSDTNIGTTKNEYAKINFDQPETSSFNIRKNNN